jgi:glycosyltransferase involved in cell wall biosynthesis
LLPAVDPGPWSEAIRKLLSFPATRQAHIDHGTEKAKGYTWERTARALIDLYLD